MNSASSLLGMKSQQLICPAHSILIIPTKVSHGILVEKKREILIIDVLTGHLNASYGEGKRGRVRKFLSESQ
jgi:hypothetical protein